MHTYIHLLISSSQRLNYKQIHNYSEIGQGTKIQAIMIEN